MFRVDSAASEVAGTTTRTTAAPTSGAWDPEAGPRVAGWALRPTKAGAELPTTTCHPATRTGAQDLPEDSVVQEVS